MKIRTSYFLVFLTFIIPISINAQSGQHNKSSEQSKKESSNQSELIDNLQEKKSGSTITNTLESTTTPIEEEIQNEQPFYEQTQNNTNVDESSGTLNYSYPIFLPPGRNDLTPQLSLSYRSDRKQPETLIGYGWELSIPYIQRHNTHGVDQMYDRRDFFSSMHGEVVYIDSTNSGEENYLPRILPNDFSEYVYNNQIWKYRTKEGITYQFGTSSTSKMDDPNNNSRIYRWYLSSISDTYGNSVNYSYEKQNGSVVLKNIEWVEGLYQLKFNYFKDSSYTSYASDYPIRYENRLELLKLTVDSQVTSTYIFEYNYSALGRQPLLTNIKHKTINVDTLIEFILKLVLSPFKG